MNYNAHHDTAVFNCSLYIICTGLGNRRGRAYAPPPLSVPEFMVANLHIHVHSTSLKSSIEYKCKSVVHGE